MAIMIVRPLRSRVQYKIIIPFLLLTLLVALAGSTTAFLFVTGNAQERLNNQLAQTARVVADAIVRQESSNLTFLRELVFAGPNADTGAPAVADALAAGDVAGLGAAVEPFVRISQRRGVQLDRLIIFDSTGKTVLHRERDESASAAWIDRPPRDMSGLWFVQRILTGAADVRGDSTPACSMREMVRDTSSPSRQFGRMNVSLAAPSSPRASAGCSPTSLHSRNRLLCRCMIRQPGKHLPVRSNR
jgi:hypothetical protein